MKIAIGIATWNEEASIGLTLDSIFKQSLFQKSLAGLESIDVVVLANGCTDESVPRAEAALQRNLALSKLKCVTGRVIEIPTPGKSNAWNCFMHEITSSDVDYMFMMDADIILNREDTMWNMVHGLACSPRQHVAAALAIKDIELRPRKTFWHRLSLSFTNLEREARHYYMCGALYCGRASFFRNWLFPEGWVSGDDGWLAWMAVTNFLTTEQEFDRILYPQDAEFVFEAYTSIPKLFRQHRRRQIGSAIRQIVMDFVRSKQIDSQPDAGFIVRSACSLDPNWLKKEIEGRLRVKGFWVIPWRNLGYRFTQLRRQPFHKKIMKMPLVAIGTVWHAAVIVSANRMFQTRTFSGAWQSNPNTRLVEITSPPHGHTSN
jgi:glycosyltransferase involved in cell wall biosynthesis